MMDEKNFLLQGPAGDLEVLMTENFTHSAIAIICHPHPLFGGTMNNKVVTTLARTFRELGLRTVRFNFRGVGKSTGTFDQGVGELQDLYAVIDWIKKTYPNSPIWLSGFSFGAYIATKVATEIAMEKLICVAPPVINFKMQDLPQILCPWIVVQGEQDEVISAEAVFQWVETREPKPLLIRMPDAGHFFHGKLLELRQQLFNLCDTSFPQ